MVDTEVTEVQTSSQSPTETKAEEKLPVVSSAEASDGTSKGTGKKRKVTTKRSASPKQTTSGMVSIRISETETVESDMHDSLPKPYEKREIVG